MSHSDTPGIVRRIRASYANALVADVGLCAHAYVSIRRCRSARIAANSGVCKSCIERLTVVEPCLGSIPASTSHAPRGDRFVRLRASEPVSDLASEQFAVVG
jgi:hypothetical protein